jgi:hypothetical protein
MHDAKYLAVGFGSLDHFPNSNPAFSITESPSAESSSIGGQISPARLYPYAKANLRAGL